MKTHKTEFTLTKVVLAIIVMGVLASSAIPLHINFKEKARIELAKTELKIIEKKIINRVREKGKLPEDLSEIGLDKVIDPWGRPYKYLKIYGRYEVKYDQGKPRKNQSQKPINTDFDLYSVGRDGNSMAPLFERLSRDDIIRANNGAYMGLVSDY